MFNLSNRINGGSAEIRGNVAKDVHRSEERFFGSAVHCNQEDDGTRQVTPFFIKGKTRVNGIKVGAVFLGHTLVEGFWGGAVVFFEMLERDFVRFGSWEPETFFQPRVFDGVWFVIFETPSYSFDLKKHTLEYSNCLRVSTFLYANSTNVLLSLRRGPERGRARRKQDGRQILLL
jgi:hypothetical protein